MEPTLRTQLIKKRAVAKGMLTRIQNFIELVTIPNQHEIKVRLNNPPGIKVRFDTVQDELEFNDECDHTDDRIVFETQYYQVEAKLYELLHNIYESSDNVSDHSSVNLSRSVHSGSSQIRLPPIELPSFGGDICKWL
jgi:hypothetical protein